MRLAAIKITTFSFLVLLSQPVLAVSTNNELVCPSVSSIKSVGVEQALQNRDGRWIAIKNKEKYDTQDCWDFMVGPFTAVSSADALAQANRSLSSLVFKESGVGGGHGGPLIACFYEGIFERSKVKAATFWNGSCSTIGTAIGL
jgi:hypothetical protein